MSISKHAIGELTTARERFDRSTSLLTESMSAFAPVPGAMTAAQHVAHVAQVLDWFLEGAFRPEGFDLDFEPQIQKVLAIDSLAAARAWLDRSFSAAIAKISLQSDTELQTPLPEGPILGGLPRAAILSAIIDHTAHHRGALTVYARLNNLTPPDPYNADS